MQNIFFYQKTKSDFFYYFCSFFKNHTFFEYLATLWNELRQTCTIDGIFWQNVKMDFFKWLFRCKFSCWWVPLKVQFKKKIFVLESNYVFPEKSWAIFTLFTKTQNRFENPFTKNLFLTILFAFWYAKLPKNLWTNYLMMQMFFVFWS